MVFPDYQPVTDDKARKRFEDLWGMKLSGKVGLTTVEIVNEAYNGNVKGLYIEGENPAMSDPDSNHARAGLANLDLLIVQDIFLTETAYFADVVLPASAFPEKTGTFINSDRSVQLGRQALDPPGEARQDLWIIQEIAKRMGLDWHYDSAEPVFNEMRQGMDSIAGITWERLQTESVTYPCKEVGDAGSPVIFTKSFPTPSGKTLLVPATIVSPDETPDEEYPFVLITGRQLEHWHTGSMTRRASKLDALEPEAYVAVNQRDLLAIGVQAGEPLKLQTRRGEITVKTRIDDLTPSGTVYMPFCYFEGAANQLTNAALDPDAKIAEVKYCAIRISAA
jgi:formate dehydrogenase major subunit